jgi:hypothetical protein
MKDSFVHQVLNHGLTPNINYESYTRPDLRDVSEILFRTDSDVRAAGCAQLSQLVDDVQIGRFVGREIVRPKVASFFGEVADQTSELRGGQSIRLSLSPWLPANGGDNKTQRQSGTGNVNQMTANGGLTCYERSTCLTHSSSPCEHQERCDKHIPEAASCHDLKVRTGTVAY